MLTITFSEKRDILIKVVKKITKIDKVRGSYLARHILVDEINKTIEYRGDQNVLKNTLEIIKISNLHFKNK